MHYFGHVKNAGEQFAVNKKSRSKVPLDGSMLDSENRQMPCKNPVTLRHSRARHSQYCLYDQQLPDAWEIYCVMQG
jgi:hypothetical protein